MSPEHGTLLALWRQKNGLTQRILAVKLSENEEKIKITQSKVSLAEQGAKTSYIEVVDFIVKILNGDKSYFFPVHLTSLTIDQQAVADGVVWQKKYIDLQNQLIEQQRENMVLMRENQKLRDQLAEKNEHL